MLNQNMSEKNVKNQDNKKIVEELKQTTENDAVIEGTFKTNNSKGNIQFINIIGYIEGHGNNQNNQKVTKYEHLIPMLVSIAQDDDVDGVLVILNTMGGDVEAGLAISELISSIGKPTVSLVLGGGHSIGVPLAVSSDYSFVAKTATMLLHPIRVNGTVVGSEQQFNYFYKMQERVFGFILDHSNIKKDKLEELMFDTRQLSMDVGTVLIGEECVKCGLIDQLGGVNEAISKLYELIKVNKDENKSNEKQSEKRENKENKKENMKAKK